jgi:hypothetical protein
MPSPLHFSEERDLLLALAQPIGQRLAAGVPCRRRQELEAMRTSPAAPASCTGSCARFRGNISPARIAQRVAALPQRQKGEVQHYGRGRDLSVVERPGFFRIGQRWGQKPPLHESSTERPGCGWVLAVSRPPLH